ncbi:MAG TPA: ABC transporter ATP-binding protein, partial [Gammaproteobacteria bacterium]|nr:ABC transporter ATP-binding protein [Gammaproteobacteria bacterium]
MTATAEAQSGVRTENGAYFSCHDLHAYYGESYIVQGVSFEIKEKEVVA